MTSRLQIHPLSCLLILELGTIGISALITGKMLGFANRGRWKDTVRLEQKEKDFLLCAVHMEPVDWLAGDWLCSLQQSSRFTCGPYRWKVLSYGSHTPSIFVLLQTRVVAIPTVAVSASLRVHSIFLRHLLLVNNLYIKVSLFKLLIWFLYPGWSLADIPWKKGGKDKCKLVNSVGERSFLL